MQQSSKLFRKPHGLQRLSDKLIKRSSSTTVIEEASKKDSLHHAKPFKDIPGFKPFPGIGTRWVFLPFIGKYRIDKSHEYDLDKYRLYGNVVRDQFGQINAVSIYDPDDFENLLRNDRVYPSRGPLTSLKVYRELRRNWYKSLGIVNMEGKEWYEYRSKVQKTLLKTKVADQYVETMSDVAADFVTRVAQIRNNVNEVPDLIPELYKFALESVICVGLNRRLGCLDPNLTADSQASKIIEAVNKSFQCIFRMESVSGTLPFWKYFPTPTWNLFVKHMDFFTQVLFDFVNESLMNTQINSAVREEELTFLQSMLVTKNLDVSGIVTMVMDMVMGGIETTSHLIGYILYRLALNPDKQEKLYEEVKTMLPLETDKLLPHHLREAKYIKYCLKETLRLDPLARFLLRITDQDIVLSGYHIPAETTVFIMMQIAGRSEKNFSKPNEFIPERWMNHEEKPHPFSHLPFGFGTRNCIGKRIAELETLAVIAAIVRKYKLEYHHEPIGYSTRMVLCPDRPLKITFIDRK